MNHGAKFVIPLLLLAGCHPATPTPQEEQASLLKAIHSDRLKRSEDHISPLHVHPDDSLMAEGIWIPEPDDSAHALAFPEQTRILCNKGEENCMEIEIRFVTVGDVTTVKGPEETIWPIKSWDRDSLLAEYGPWPQFPPGPDKCQKHVLSIVFASGTVTTSDIPTHGEGCEAFKETNSYRLAGGYYALDTSPRNDAARDTSAK